MKAEYFILQRVECPNCAEGFNPGDFCRECDGKKYITKEVPCYIGAGNMVVLDLQSRSKEVSEND